ncbi:hypothetical protein EDB89DRAFT_1889739 [Lactarius sanguifluus]|nr:hypothetical protein EDB89DRAFT_1889739 [Lactarius sanguifluus]
MHKSIRGAKEICFVRINSLDRRDVHLIIARANIHFNVRAVQLALSVDEGPRGRCRQSCIGRGSTQHNSDLICCMT